MRVPYAPNGVKSEGSTSVSTAMYRPEDPSTVTSYGVGHGFLDGMLIPRIHFKPCLPPSRLAELRRKRAAASAKVSVRTFITAPKPEPLQEEPIASTSRIPSPKGKEKECNNLFHETEEAKANAKQSNAAQAFVKRLEGASLGKSGITRDKQEIAQITYQVMQGSLYFENEKIKDEVLAADIAAVLADIEARTARRKGDLREEEREAEQIAKLLEKERDLSQIVVCCDADAFYASVEELFQPSLVGTCFIVGGGIVLTASYEARKFGCRSAQAGHVARQLCPHVTVVEPSFDRYVAKSKEIMAVLSRFGPMAQASMDEGYLNITDYLKENDLSIDEALQKLRQAVKEETGLTVSCGAGANKLLAKIAADKNKPNGQCFVPLNREDIMAFLADLPVRKLPGLGRVSEAWLSALGIELVSDIWRLRGKLGLVRGDIKDLLRGYLGINNNSVSGGQKEDRMSCGRGWTFLPTTSYDQWLVELRAMAEQVAEDLASAQISGRTITLEIKYDTFEVENRSHSGNDTSYYSKAEDIYRIGKKLLDKELEKRKALLKAGKPVKGSAGAADPKLRRMSLRVAHIRDDSPLARSKRGEDATDLLSTWMQQDGEIIDLTQDSASNRFLEDVICPICERSFSAVTKRTLQSHVEDCLEAQEEAPPSLRKKRKQDSCSEPQNGKRSKADKRKSNAFDALMSARSRS